MHYALIKHCDMVNGPGLRVSLFVSGCEHNCPGCFNQETHDPCYGSVFNDNSYNELYDDLKEPWCKGLTLLGGDPLYPANRQEILSLVKRVKSDFPSVSIWCYTGYTLSQIQSMNDPYINGILNTIDVLLDGPYVKELNSPDKQWVGSSNQHIYHIYHHNSYNEFVQMD